MGLSSQLENNMIEALYDFVWLMESSLDIMLKGCLLMFILTWFTKLGGK